MNGLYLIFLIVVFKDDDPVAVSARSYPDDDMPLGCQELVRIDIAVKEKLRQRSTMFVVMTLVSGFAR